MLYSKIALLCNYPHRYLRNYLIVASLKDSSKLQFDNKIGAAKLHRFSFATDASNTVSETPKVNYLIL